jgi:hypothetical protein
VIFYCIVELLDATADDYERLDGAMAVAGFTRTTRSKNGESYKLPTGVYRSQCRLHASEVLNIARSIANSTGRANEVMTIESDRARWFPSAGSPTSEAATTIE